MVSPGAGTQVRVGASVKQKSTSRPTGGLWFQGREKEVIIISFVRSNSKGEIGFLQEIRRTNVAITRSRRKLILIGDSATLANHPFYARLIEYAESVGGYRTVWEEPEVT